MPAAFQEFVPFGGPQKGPGRWFEEDADWSVVAAAFPQFFSDDDVRAAHATLRGYRPEIYKALCEPDNVVRAGEVAEHERLGRSAS
jgi:hypothetical protein